MAAQAVVAQSVEARVQSLRGAVTRGNLPLRRLDVLQPGDMIETGAQSRVVISLSDGSLITVAANSRIVLKNFRQATNLRELLDAVAGRVRAKIHHLGNRPNPYRLNSPVASIAVRGTEFDVAVAASGETRVTVYEGLVEVTSLRDPAQRRLVEAGRNVIVRATGDIALNLPGPGGVLRGQAARLSEPALGANAYGTLFSVSFDAQAAREQYLRNVLEPSLNAAPARFAAFADEHFDSLGNPAYATEFQQAAGRVYLLPSFNTPWRSFGGGARAQAEKLHALDYTGGGQASYFAPLGARAVIGGSAAWQRTRLESFARSAETLDSYTDSETLAGVSADNTGYVAFSAARRMGAGERTSLGAGLEYVAGRSTISTLQTVVQHDAQGAIAGGWQRYAERAAVARTRLTLGLTQTLVSGPKLGVFYRYGVGRAATQFELAAERIAFDNAPLDETRRTRSHEFGARLRGGFNSHWFYGLEAAWLRERLSQRTQETNGLRGRESTAWRGNAGGGLGYAPRPQTVFSLDLAGGARGAAGKYFHTLPGGGLAHLCDAEAGRFVSTHLGAQTLFKQHWLASATWLALHEWSATGPRRPGETNHFSNFGAGWRGRAGWTAQYVFSINYQHPRPTHGFVLRYDFTRER